VAFRLIQLRIANGAAWWQPDVDPLKEFDLVLNLWKQRITVRRNK